MAEKKGQLDFLDQLFSAPVENTSVSVNRKNNEGVNLQNNNRGNSVPPSGGVRRGDEQSRGLGDMGVHGQAREREASVRENDAQREGTGKNSGLGEKGGRGYTNSYIESTRADAERLYGSAWKTYGPDGGVSVRDGNKGAYPYGEISGDGSGLRHAYTFVTASEKEKEKKKKENNNYRFSEKEWSEYTSQESFNKREAYRTNISVLETLVRLKTEKRSPSAEEQSVLASYKGWGGLKEILLEPNDQWKDTAERYRNEVVRVRAVFSDLERVNYPSAKDRLGFRFPSVVLPK
ncbi:DNA methylase [Elysia marginata]|uniref:DNA methylase n=1 Tax=Elysia marginata TaxID=1093978 RepID=A0AAV4IGN9_9GAST|nr:DNA methylase [Elysia marginata]